jgi:hypothetical protein
MADEEVEGQEAEAAPAGAEFVPDQGSHKPKSDVYSVLLVLTFVAFLAGCVVAGREAWEHYDVQFFVFTKHPPKDQSGGGGGGATGNTSAPEPAPAPSGTGAPK